MLFTEMIAAPPIFGKVPILILITLLVKGEMDRFQPNFQTQVYSLAQGNIIHFNLFYTVRAVGQVGVMWVQRIKWVYRGFC